MEHWEGIHEAIPQDMSDKRQNMLNDTLKTMYPFLVDITPGEALWVVRKIGDELPAFATMAVTINKISKAVSKEYVNYDRIMVIIGGCCIFFSDEDCSTVRSCLINVLFGDCLKIATETD